MCAHVLPAYGTLTVGRTLGNGQSLTDLRLCQAERQTAQLKRFGKLFNFVQIDAVHHVGGVVQLVDGRLIWMHK